MNHWLLRWAALALLWNASGCSFPEVQIGPGERHLVIHAVLDAGNREQTVYLAYTDNGDYTSKPTLGAVVTITTPSGVTMRAVEDTAVSTNPSFSSRYQHLYRIDLDANGVSLVPGGTYTLNVKTADAKTASGTTTIPQASRATASPMEAFVVSKDTLRLSWAAVPGAESYEVQIARITTFDDFRYRYVPYTVFTTKPVELTGNSKDPVEDNRIFIAPSMATATVLAVDANYYHYYRRLADPYVGASPSRLVGAVGVFGSVVPVVVRQLDVR